jgi:large repetitive protein
MTRRLGGIRRQGLAVLASLSLVATMACGAVITGCGGDDTGGTGPVDGATEGNAPDSTPDVTPGRDGGDGAARADADAGNATPDADSGTTTPDADAGNTTSDADAARSPDADAATAPDADAATQHDADAATQSDADAATQRDADASPDSPSNEGGDAGDGAVHTYTVGGTLSGLGNGTVTLQDNGGDSLPLSANGAFTFTTALANAVSYAVTVSTQPAGQTCAVTAGTGTIANANVTNVSVQCTTNTYTVGGTVFGLATDAGPAGLVLQNNGSDTVTVNANGGFTFPTAIASAGTYSVTVMTQPAGQHCTLTGATGTIAAANVTSVSVNCANDLFTVGGTLNGLAGGSVTLQDNGGNDLVLSSTGAFGFSTPIATGQPYAVTVSANPTSPAQTCVVSNGSGTMGSAAVTNVSVNCTTNTYVVGGTVTGLSGGDQIVVQDNAGDNTTITGDGAFHFPTPVASGGVYAVTLVASPTAPVSETCVVTNGAGTVGAANVTNVAVTCSINSFSVGGSVVGLAAGGGNNVVLQDNGADTLAVSADGTFTFHTVLPSSLGYSVTVSAQPTNPPQTCTVSAGAGTVGNGNVTSVVVNCSNDFTIGGTVTGLNGGTLILEDNGANDTSITANTAYAFSQLIVAGNPYAVTVSTQPSVPSQTCVVSNGTGTANGNVTNANINCTTNTFVVGGTVTGLSSGETFTVQDTANGNVQITISANGNFVFPASVASGNDYNVVVHTSPAGPIFETCTVTNGSGTIGAANIQNIAINCTPTPFTIGGTVTNFGNGTGLVLQDNLGDNLPISANGAFTFATSVASGQPYSVTVFSQPSGPTQVCTATNNTGTVVGANVTSVTINCVTQHFTVGGTLTGLDTSSGNTVTLQDNAGDNLVLGANAPFTFATSVLSGDPFAVTVLTNPTNPVQTCVVTSGSGTVGGANVTGVVVNCSTNQFTIGGSVVGLNPLDEVILLDNGGDTLQVTSSNAASFTFAGTIASGATYAVTVQQSAGPVSQSCTVTAHASGTVTNAAITNVQVTCTTNSFHVGGTISGLAAGDSVVLADGAGHTQSFSASPFQFPTALLSGTAYDVTVTTQPDPANSTGPTQQVCTATVNTGIVGAADVTSVVITCVTTQYTVNVHVDGLVTNTPVQIDLQNNGGNDVVVSSNATAHFTTKIDNNSTYAVTIASQPNNTLTQSQICNVGSVLVGGSLSPTAAGTMPTNDITVEVRCGRTCASIHGSNPAAGDGIFLIDPDGTGPITQFSAYCLMQFDGGGWTLIESTNGGGPANGVPGVVTQNSAKWMPVGTIDALANLSSRVHVRSPVSPGTDPPLNYVESVGGVDNAVILNLRVENNLNAAFVDPVNNANQESFWSVPVSDNTIPGGNDPNTVHIFDFNCMGGIFDSWPDVYDTNSCGANAAGWQLAGAFSEWQAGALTNIPLEVYAR